MFMECRYSNCADMYRKLKSRTKDANLLGMANLSTEVHTCFETIN